MRLFGFDAALINAMDRRRSAARRRRRRDSARLLWPKVEDAWNDVNMHPRRRAKA